jgi:Na+/melibiose symporter-like transporter
VLTIVAACVFWLLFFLVDYVGLPEPFNKVAHVGLMVAAVLVLIGLILDAVGYDVFKKGP